MWWLAPLSFLFGFLFGKWQERNWPGSWPRNGKSGNGNGGESVRRAAL